MSLPNTEPAPTLVEFLTARLDEDQQVAEFVQRESTDGDPFEPWKLSWQDEYNLLCIEPARALAEVKAKRSLVEDIHHRIGGVGATAGSCEGCSWGRPTAKKYVILVEECPTLRRLALPYADHPDYRQEWRL